ncbi:MAG: hypothetical protein U0S49_12580 [Rhodospirillales bacterium]|nr:hypothetical protein [Rhodospirillales bacterium]
MLRKRATLASAPIHRRTPSRPTRTTNQPQVSTFCCRTFSQRSLPEMLLSSRKTSKPACPSCFSSRTAGSRSLRL